MVNGFQNRGFLKETRKNYCKTFWSLPNTLMPVSVSPQDRAHYQANYQQAQAGHQFPIRSQQPRKYGLKNLFRVLGGVEDHHWQQIGRAHV